MMFIFDDRPERQRENKLVFNVFETQAMPPPELVGVSFVTSHKLLPLQAAHLIAWEFYQYAKDTLESGRIELPKRQQFKRLRQEIEVFDLQIARRESIEKIAGWRVIANTSRKRQTFSRCRGEGRDLSEWGLCDRFTLIYRNLGVERLPSP